MGQKRGESAHDLVEGIVELVEGSPCKYGLYKNSTNAEEDVLKAPPTQMS